MPTPAGGMEEHRNEDKSGQALHEQRFRMLADIARDLCGDVVFPTCFDVTLRLRQILHDDGLSAARIGALVAVEPLLCSRLLHLANSVIHNPGATPILDIRTAVIRLGLDTVRAATLATVMRQLLLSREMVHFADLAEGLWRHSLRSAAGAAVIARRLSRSGSDEAMLAGLVHDIGAFYTLYRATQYEELRERPETVRHLVVQWHEGVGEMVLKALGMPENIIAAVREHDQAQALPARPRSLADIVRAANLMAGGSAAWSQLNAAAAEEARLALDPAYQALQPEIVRYAEELQAALK